MKNINNHAKIQTIEDTTKTNRHIHITKEQMLQIIAEANELIPFYRKANKENPKNFYDFRNADTVALRKLESMVGGIFTGVKLAGENINVHYQNGILGDNGKVEIYKGTNNIVLDGFKESGTIAKFAINLADTLDERVDKGSSDLKGIMMPNLKAYTATLRKNINLYHGWV